MKQYITEIQFNELSNQAKQKLILWSKTCKSFQAEILEGDYDPNIILLSIGQMIEFLYEKVGQEEFNTNIGEVGVEPTGIDIYLPDKPSDSPTGRTEGGRVLIAWKKGRIWENKKIIGTENPGELCDLLWIACKEVLEK